MAGGALSMQQEWDALPVRYGPVLLNEGGLVTVKFMASLGVVDMLDRVRSQAGEQGVSGDEAVSRYASLSCKAAGIAAMARRHGLQSNLLSQSAAATELPVMVTPADGDESCVDLRVSLTPGSWLCTQMLREHEISVNRAIAYGSTVLAAILEHPKLNWSATDAEQKLVRLLSYDALRAGLTGSTEV
jgi:hypothetical protein